MTSIVIVILIYHIYIYIALTCWARSGGVMCFLLSTNWMCMLFRGSKVIKEMNQCEDIAHT
jgi:hypothetical protein